MNISVRVCDKCKKEARGSYGEDYGRVGLFLCDEAECLYTTDLCNPIDLCPECMAKLGFVKKVKEATEQKDTSIIERIYDIIAEIVAGVMEERS